LKNALELSFLLSKRTHTKSRAVLSFFWGQDKKSENLFIEVSKTRSFLETKTLDRVIKLKDRKQAKIPDGKRIIKKKRRFVFIASFKLPIDNW